eukprot:TRINITY_DN14043_c0_g1_i1.p1 TRINITY_DN14043_c0_g1~~TRINITY_DN14043_c0_g1_i1.p1  ORF type:complete len:258 (+),score=39.02 TRINITY_DN14043_c0_g1_i1:567-1340(+)
MALPAELEFDDKGAIAKPEPGFARGRLRSALGHLAALTLTLSLGRATAFSPLLEGAPGADANLDPVAMPLLGFPKALPAVYLQTIFLYCMLATMLESYRCVLALFGLKCHAIMRHPLLRSTSVRDFWGRRWNLLIHRLMHRSFFTTVKPKFGPQAAAVAAFVTSGLFHEYMWWVTNFESRHYVAGGPLMFFTIQFLTCVVEAALAKTCLVGVAKRLPTVVKTAIVTSVCLPFGPLFLYGLREWMMDAANIYPSVVLV